VPARPTATKQDERESVPLGLGERRLRVHIVGLGGANMSTIAAVLRAMGHEVSGSDQQPSKALDRLAAMGVRAFIGHDAANVAGADVVAFSAAVRSSNVEVEEARRRGIPVLSRAAVLSEICALKRAVAVSGAHGKTTTTAMLAAVLAEAGFDPCYMVGGELAGARGGARWGPGEWLVVEADESDGTFLRLPAEAVLVTSVEADHLDYWGDTGAIEEAFSRFVQAPEGPRAVGTDSPAAARLAPLATVTFGTSAQAEVRASGIELGPMSSSFDLEARGRDLGRFWLRVPGAHNVSNAAGAVALALELGAGVEAARSALAKFEGVARRFQFRGARDGVTYVDDYAHNPGKVRAALAAARAGGWGRVVAVFQPHLYSRTVMLLGSYATAFEGADVLYVTSVYGAREDPWPGVDGNLIAQAVTTANPAAEVYYVPDRAALVGELRRCLRPGDLCLTMSAGDLTTLPDELLGREEAELG
jgi:UDP-N-acetylmuramate--alanine ligase